MRRTRSGSACRSRRWPSRWAPSRRPAAAAPFPRPETVRGLSSSAWGRRPSRPRRTCAALPVRASGRRPRWPAARSRSPSRSARRAPTEASAVAEGALLGSYRFAPISTAAPRAGIDRDDHRRPCGQHPRQRGGRRCPDAGPRRRPGPRVGQHAGQPALSGVVRRPGRRTGQGLGGIGRGARREGVDPRRIRRPARGRRRIGPAAAAGPVQLRPARRQGASGTGRQGHHVRHRRAEPQARRRHVHDEVRHGGRGRGAGRHPRHRRTRPEDQGHRVRARWPRTCRRAPRTGPRTC